MNRERMIALRKRIADAPDGEFDMGSFCGAACCIAGHALRMKHGIDVVPVWDIGTFEPFDLEHDAAAAYLGLDYDEADALFYARWQDAPTHLIEVTKEEGLRHLDEFIANDGDVPWVLKETT